MNLSRIVVDTACILKRTNVGEADKIITILSRKHGKMRVIAKGVRKISSRRGPHLDIFNIVKITVHQGKTLDVVQEATSLFSGRLIYTTWVKMRAAYVVTEVVDKLLPEKETQENIYVSVEEILRKIGVTKDDDIESVLIDFLNTLLVDLGYVSEEKKINELQRLIPFIERITERKIRSAKFLSA